MADGEGSGAQLTSPEIQDENSVTLQDILDQEQELQDDANAVLGGSDDKNCTYEQGYVRRQALYACSTCVSPNSRPAGICLACSYACHEGHQLYELYTKRNFRCDCGNSRFPSTNPCRLCPAKDATNAGNDYNQNFHGCYCTCGRPYPDPEDDVDDEMLQCVMCEDWYHGRHLGGEVPANRDYSEVICVGCMSQHPFLWHYLAHAVASCKAENDESFCVDDSACNGSSANGLSGMTPVDLKPSVGTKGIGVQDGNVTPCSNGFLGAVATNGTSGGCNSGASGNVPPTSGMAKVEMHQSSSGCVLQRLCGAVAREGPAGRRCAFWPPGWRSQLCRCHDCMAMYEAQHCQFLLDEDDTVQSYEERGKAAQPGPETGDPLMSALGTLGRVQQIEAIHGYNNLKTELTDFLKKFATSKTVVREEDVREFFDQMQARKRQKVSAVPYFCR
ncbi:unnamed protein product [Ixodes persulcatus]